MSNQIICLHFSCLFTNCNSKHRSIFSLSGLNYVDSSLIFNPFEDDQFEDVSKVQKSYIWKYFLLDKANHKAKCKVKIGEGQYCDRVYSSQEGATTGAMKNHLKNHHGIFYYLANSS